MKKKAKDLIKLFLSYILNPFTLVRIGKIGKWIDVRKGLKVNDPQNIFLGNYVCIGRYSRISSFSGGKIVIMDNCNIGQFFTILAGGNITIKTNTLIASFVAIISENHGINPEIGIRYGIQPLISKDISIGENCWIGEKVTILPGVSIGDWSIIGAGSVVNSSIPSYSIAVGNPARIIKKYNFENHKWERV